MQAMLSDLRRGAVALAAFTVLVGLAYPLVVFGIGQAAFRGAADGSLVFGADGQVVGSRLIGQPFDAPGYFWGRPSAAGDGYDAGASGASNLGPTSRRLAGTVRQRIRALLAANPGRTAADIPAELVTASGSGLDPDISPRYADLQVHRIAEKNGLSVAQVQKLVDDHTEGRTLGFMGEPRVNVLDLNIALRDLAATS
jgi:K+-transporting ATPase ATPase C chain